MVDSASAARHIEIDRETARPPNQNRGRSAPVPESASTACSGSPANSTEPRHPLQWQGHFIFMEVS